MAHPKSRATRKASTKHGSQNSTASTGGFLAGITQDVTAGLTGLAQILAPLGHSTNRRTHLYNDPSPLYKPMLVPGVPGRAGSTAYVGKMFPDRTVSKSPYGFRFHYNPASIEVSSQSDYNAVNDPSMDGTTNFFYNYGTMAFTILLNRQDEVMAGTETAHRCMGTRNFAELGTLYDVEWMYRVFNSAPEDIGGTNGLQAIASAGLYESSIGYILKASATHVQFNKHLKYYGWPTAIDVQHQMFTANMVPTITMVQITLSGLAPQPPVGTPSSVSTSSSTSNSGTSGNGTRFHISNGIGSGGA